MSCLLTMQTLLKYLIFVLVKQIFKMLIKQIVLHYLPKRNVKKALCNIGYTVVLHTRMSLIFDAYFSNNGRGQNSLQ